MFDLLAIGTSLTMSSEWKVDLSSALRRRRSEGWACPLGWELQEDGGRGDGVGAGLGKLWDPLDMQVGEAVDRTPPRMLAWIIFLTASEWQHWWGDPVVSQERPHHVYRELPPPQGEEGQDLNTCSDQGRRKGSVPSEFTSRVESSHFLF